MTVAVTKHAVKRAQERFGVSHKVAERWIRQHYEQAEFVAEIPREEGGTGRLFAHNGIAIILAPDENVVITVYKPGIYGDLKRKISALVDAEYRRAQTKARRNERRGLTKQYEMERELADRKLELLRARSEWKRMALRGRIAALESRIDEMPAEVEACKRELAPYAKAVAAVV